MQNKIKKLEKSLKQLTEQVSGQTQHTQRIRSRLGEVEDTVSLNTKDIRSNKRDIESNTEGISSNKRDILDQMDSRFDQMEDAVRVNTGMILANTRDMQSFERDIQNLQESANTNKTTGALLRQSMSLGA